MNKDILFLLNQWRIWQLSKTGIPRYVSPAYVTVRDNVEQMIDSDLDPLVIDDELALLIDKSIATMRGRSEHWYQSIKLHHGPRQLPLRAVARELHTNHQQVSLWLDQSRAWLDARILTVEEMA